MIIICKTVLLFDHLITGVSHLGNQIRMRNQVTDFRPQILLRIVLKQIAVYSMPDIACGTVGVTANHRQRTGHGFQLRYGSPFSGAGQDKYISLAIQVKYLPAGQIFPEFYLGTQPHFINMLLQRCEVRLLFPVNCFSCNLQNNPALRKKLLQSFHQHKQPFLLLISSHAKQPARSRKGSATKGTKQEFFIKTHPSSSGFPYTGVIRCLGSMAIRILWPSP